MKENLQYTFPLEKQDLQLVPETLRFVFLNRQLSQCKGSSFAAAIKESSSYKTEAFASAWLAIGQETVEKFIYALSKDELFI